MTFRRLFFSPFRAFVLGFSVLVSAPAWSQTRPGNRLSLTLLRPAYSGARLPTRPMSVSARMPVPLPARAMPRSVLLASARIGPRVTVWNNSVSRPNPIALGAYFYQNGECAPGDAGAVSAWKSRAGRLPAVWTIFQSWTGWNQFPIDQARRARQLGGRLMVTWEPWNGDRSDAQWSCAAIAAGARDAYIRQYARAVKTSGVPVMIRFAHEMNGDWYPWATAYESGYGRHNGNSPQNYVAMWRRVVALFRAEGAYNAQWVWAPNIQYLNRFNAPQTQNADLSALYPGDNCVDWIGISVYNDASRRSWRTFADLFDSTYRTLTQISAKPMMIAEIGVTEVGAPRGTSKADWISQALLRDIPQNYPRVRLVNWFCRDKSGVGEANYRFDSSPSALAAFRGAINSPLYGARLGGG